MSFRMPRPTTQKVLVAIAVLFAVLAGISTVAWLLPNAFYGLGDALVRLTGNPDIRLNVVRIGNDPVPYAIIFALFALGVRWLAGKF